jgi:hypothetical protein
MTIAGPEGFVSTETGQGTTNSWRPGQIEQQHFDGDVPVEVRVVRAVDDGHSAPANLSVDPVPRWELHGGRSIQGPFRLT